jgi:murein L,D-transpeptidase YcbB/YkuD
MTKGLMESILIEQGFLDNAFINDSTAVKTALKNYQILNSLEPTGVGDINTFIKLGRSTNEIFNQIALNLDRLRKDELETENYILVNIPEFTLYYISEDGSINNFNVVVGKDISPTPILTSKIELIVTNPHWTVPNSIALNEIIPKIRTDSTYLAKHGYKVVDKDANAIDESVMDWQNMNQQNFRYYIRQEIGEKNALGAIKFLFPNEHSVYLHDTPSKQYFKKDIRAFSHGCVRVENPEKLAQMIISEHCFNQENFSIENILSSKKQRAIKIDEPVPIYIKYYTCTADSNGNIYFHPDIYSYDNEAIQQLFASNYPE